MRSWTASLPLPRMLRKFSQRDAVDRRLVIEAIVTVPLIQVALSLLPLRIVLALASRVAVAAPTSVIAVDRITWAITTVSRRVPRAMCLTQALAAMLLLARHGHHSTLRLGVAKNGGTFSAHAWLECRGRTVIGAEEPGSFATLAGQGKVVASSRPSP